MLPIISADQRLAEKSGVKLVLLGKSGLGKTSQLKTLQETSTLFIDLEAGDLSVKHWRGDSIRPQTWPETRDLVVFLAGPNPALPPDAPYSQAHFEHVCQAYGDPAQLATYDTYFVDSLSVLSRQCLSWAKTQPAAQSERSGKPDLRGAYGLLGAEMIGALTHLQHARDKHVIFVAILDEVTDEFGRKVFTPQLDGSKTALQLPGIVDEVITYAELKTDAPASLTRLRLPHPQPLGPAGQGPLRSPRADRATGSGCADCQVRGRPSRCGERAAQHGLAHHPCRHPDPGGLLMSFFDFNDAEQQQGFELIPAGTLARVCLRLKPGGFDDPNQGWTGGWATRSAQTDAVYLACEAVILEGPYAKRKLWWNIGLHSPKGPTWMEMGRTFMRALLNSARHIHPGDTSPQAQQARRIQGFGELDGLEFVARIGIEQDGRGEQKNTVKAVVEPDHPDYAALMGLTPGVGQAPAPAAAAAQPASATPLAPGGKPAWAQ